MFEEVKDYYENYDEDGRLFRDKAHMLEYLTTIRYFDCLFKPNSRILDPCAGTGRYSFYLANKGHIVTACDLVEHNLSIIRSKLDADKLESINMCNVLDLSKFSDNSYDVVLCMGAMYHLRSNDLREKAIAECVRVCRSGGMVILSYITKVGAILANIADDVSNMDDQIKILDDSDDGIFYFTSPQEIEELSVRCGLERIHNIGSDGMIYNVGWKLNNASEENFNKYIEYHYLTCEDESIVGASLHGLWIGRKQ